MITKYRTARRSTVITKVEVERETNASVWIAGNRQAKDSIWFKYHDSWEGAHDYLLQKAELALLAARRRLERAQGEYGNIKGMKPQD